MKILFESDRECTIDGVGLLKPGEPVEVNSDLFFTYHGVKPINAVTPHFIKKTVDLSDEEGGE